MIKRVDVMNKNGTPRIRRGIAVFRPFKVCDRCGAEFAPRGDSLRLYGWEGNVVSIIIDQARDLGGDFCASPCFEVVCDLLLEHGAIRKRHRNYY